MAQVKVYGLKEHLDSTKTELSDLIHSCLVDTLGLPSNKRFHRFIRLEPEDFIYPADRTKRYTIIEVSMFEGRSIESKKQLIRLLFKGCSALGIAQNDLEITLFETPKHNWGIRGVPGDELDLSYKVEVHTKRGIVEALSSRHVWRKRDERN